MPSRLASNDFYIMFNGILGQANRARDNLQHIVNEFGNLETKYNQSREVVDDYTQIVADLDRQIEALSDSVGPQKNERFQLIGRANRARRILNAEENSLNKIVMRMKRLIAMFNSYLRDYDAAVADLSRHYSDYRSSEWPRFKPLQMPTPG